MKISYNWLRSFFEKKIPSADKVAEKLTMHSFEVEDISCITASGNKDWIFDIDILPNRAHDCLSHAGVAREVSALFSIPLVRNPFKKNVSFGWPSSKRLSVKIEDFSAVQRYSALVVENVSVTRSPRWLMENLKAIGHNSINSVVDVMNYVMFDMGQPLHAFDMEKLVLESGMSAIAVRAALLGERIVTLDGVVREIPEGALVVTDGNKDVPIAIAGIKGAGYPAVSNNTRHIIIEAANFDSAKTRVSSKALNLRTDASVRFEHAISPNLTLEALSEAAHILYKMEGSEEMVVEGLVDACGGNASSNRMKGRSAPTISFSIDYANSMLGTDMEKKEARKILEALDFGCIDTSYGLDVTPPPERLDISMKEDLAEEIGRVHGYGKIKPVQLKKTRKRATCINKLFYYSGKLRRALCEMGFSEVYTYSLEANGSVSLSNPLASDKGYLRHSLKSGLSKSLKYNLKHSDLLGLRCVKIFEIGTVFTEKGEHTSLGVAAGTKVRGEKGDIGTIIHRVRKVIKEVTGVEPDGIVDGGVLEINFSGLIEKAQEPKSYEWAFCRAGDEGKKDVKYEKISPYPYVLRDIALWVPKNTGESAIKETIVKRAGELLKTCRVFDVFEKDKRTSYAFRLIFQSGERTLTDDEINYIMWNIETELNEKKGWEVR